MICVYEYSGIMIYHRMICKRRGDQQRSVTLGAVRQRQMHSTVTALGGLRQWQRQSHRLRRRHRAAQRPTSRRGAPHCRRHHHRTGGVPICIVRHVTGLDRRRRVAAANGPSWFLVFRPIWCDHFQWPLRTLSRQRWSPFHRICTRQKWSQHIRIHIFWPHNFKWPQRWHMARGHLDIHRALAWHIIRHIRRCRRVKAIHCIHGCWVDTDAFFRIDFQAVSKSKLHDWITLNLPDQTTFDHLQSLCDGNNFF